MRTTTCLVMACAAAAVTLNSPAGATPAGSSQQRFREYVALGDSWAADATFSQITTEFVPLGCVQSADSYAKQVAAALAVPQFRDATCASATTSDLTEPQLLPEGTSNPPQFDRLTADTDLVTLEIGGNDAGLAGIVPKCVTTSPTVSGCTPVRTAADGGDRMSANIRAAEPKVVAAIAGIRSRAPRARILLVDYLAGISPGRSCYPQIPITAEDANWLGHKLIELNSMLTRVAATTEVEFVDTYTGSRDHDACRPDGVRWVEGLVPYSTAPHGPAVPFHPNQLGADHQAAQILNTLRN
ncbi:SGNH/GDSL hydrolase family protein [Nocardia huaxiensis]|uniref:SGNH/GDSL hydrolase family protein n=1 Tax=Nocardia huaxiensis TaxID=2755382 RepID=UPI001E62951D|nr:SGNH/GDSL hydrolase family protein [Nocardia huaxiensis]UFS98375.1 SGNH/GDSL hydrolase family protein [Nocardia huaxiensis]